MKNSFNNVWASAKQDHSFLSLIWLLIFSMLASLAVYHYGTGNHAVIVPFLKHLVDSSLFPHDYFINQQQYYHTYLWDVFAWIINKTGITVEALFLVSFLTVMFISSIAIFGIARVLFQREDVAYLSVFLQFFYFIHNAGLGDEFLMDYLFKESQAALPLLLLAIYFFLKQHYKTSYLLQGAAFLIHPLTAIYVIALLGIPFLLISGQRGWKYLAGPLIILLIVAFPLLIRKYLHSPDSMHMFTMYLDWAEMLRVRYAGHSFPFSWSIWKFIKAALVVALFLYSWKFPPANDKHLIIKQITFTTFGLWVLAVIFTEIIPLPVFIQLQLFRSYAFLGLFALIYWANFLLENLQSQSPFWKKGLWLLLTIGLIVYLPSEGSPVIDQIWESPEVLWINNYVYIIMIGIALVGYWWRFGKRMPVNLVAGLIMLISLFYYGRNLNKGGVDLNSQQPAGWVEVQNWARTHSQLNDIFIVPPDQRGFRVDGERTIFADYKDGIQMYFNPEFGYQWMERMKTLGNPTNPLEKDLKDNYLKLTESQFRDIADQCAVTHDAVYMITFLNHQHLNFEKTYSNDEFVVYRITP